VEQNPYSYQDQNNILRFDLVVVAAFAYQAAVVVETGVAVVEVGLLVHSLVAAVDKQDSVWESEPQVLQDLA